MELATAAALLAGGSQVASMFAEGQAAKTQAKAQMQQQQAAAQAAEFNAKIAQENAATVASNTAAEAAKADRERRLRSGANIAGSGGSGNLSFLDIAMDNAAQEELNILTIKQQGLLKERSYLQQAGLDLAEAQGARSQIPLIGKAYEYQSAANLLKAPAKLYAMS